MTAVITEHRAGEVCHGLRIKLEKIPVARLAHGGFAAKFVQFEDKTGFFLFRHNTLLFAVYGTCAVLAESFNRPDLSVALAPSTVRRTAHARIDNSGGFFYHRGNNYRCAKNRATFRVICPRTSPF